VGSETANWKDQGQNKCCRELHLYLEDGKLKCTGIVRMQNANIYVKNIHFFATLIDYVAKELGVEVGEYTIYVIDKENSFLSFNGKKHCCVVIKGNGQYRVRTPFNDPESLGTIIDESIKKIIKYELQNDYYVAYENSPAFNSKLKGVITGIDDNPIRGDSDLSRVMGTYSPGDSATVYTTLDNENLTFQERMNLQRELTNVEQQQTDARIKIAELEALSKRQLLDVTANALGAFSKLAGKETAAGKALAVAKSLETRETRCRSSHQTAGCGNQQASPTVPASEP